eukprot:m.109639 g.109639  ORF g.109639 m.109639 type:complete len:172 (+) comp37360_c0_seq5:65-580(+)
MSTERFYVRGAEVDVDEDVCHEFKGHRCISVENLGPWAFHDVQQKSRTKRAASRALNSFLNSGKGGTVYLGITDDGVVRGHSMTVYQKDHTRAAVKDLLEDRYSPRVDPSQYKIEFVPVLQHAFWQNNPSNPEQIDSSKREQSHELRTKTQPSIVLFFTLPLGDSVSVIRD